MGCKKSGNTAEATAIGPRRHGDGPNIVYDYLRDQIISQHFTAGARIEEQKVVDELGLSRTPVRQAFMRLAAEGLIEMLPNHGARVPPLNIEEVHSFLEAFEFQLLATAHLATIRRNKQNLKDIYFQRDAYEAAAAAQDVKALIQTNEEFHLAIARAGHNSHMERMVADLLTKALRLDGFWYEDEFNPNLEICVARSIEEHIDLALAIEKQDLEKVEEMTRNHVRSFRQPLIDYLSQTEASGFKASFS
jgi:DNA-binding GntR family transcriptional regulator